MKKAILITISIIAMISLIFYYGLKVNESKYSEFAGNGYIISKIYDEEGNFLKSEKFYFNEGTKYKSNYNNEIVFENANKEESKVTIDSFIHYDNGSLSVLKKSAILNLDNISKETTIKYYNIYSGTILENKNSIYSIENVKTKVDFSNFIVKINDNKYILIGKNITLKLDNTEKKLENGYYEIEYIEGDIIRIENNEVTYQNVPTNVKILLGNGINIDAKTKYISKDGENILNLNEMTIDSNDNIELIPEEEKKQEEENNEGQESEEGNKHNPISGLGSGIIGTDNGNEGEEEVNENLKEIDPQFTVTEMSSTSNKFQAAVSINDPSNLLVDDITIRIIDSASNKLVYQTKELQGTMNIGIEVENLVPETSYIFLVTSSYNKGGNLYSKDFVQKSFMTESVGVSIKKDYFTTDTLAFVAEKKYYSSIKSFDATLLDKNDRIIKTITVSFDGVTSNEFSFDNLNGNSVYNLRISNYLYDDSIITDSYISDESYKTLKRRPNMGTVGFNIDKKNSNFTLKLSNVEDPDNGITQYRYEIYDARNFDAPVQVVEKNNTASIDVRVDDINLQRGLPYTFKVVALFNDNEKVYEYESEYSDVMKMDGVQFPTVSFEAQEVTFEKIQGNIIIRDDGNTISLDEGSKMTIIYTDSVGISKTFTASGNLKIPININYLRKNETYTISVYAKVDLQDGNEPIDSCFIGSTIVMTKDTNPMYLTYQVNNADTSNTFTINARLSSYQTYDTTLEANTMSGLIFNLYEGTSVNGTLVKTVRKVDRNLNEYISELKSDYYDKNFTITPSLFNLRNQDLKAEYYTIEVQEAYDYTTYKNKIEIKNNIITTKALGYIPSLPDDLNDALSVTVIRNKDVSSALYRDDLDGDTVVGYRARALYDNSNKYAKSIVYNLHNSNGDIIETKEVNVPEDGTINPVSFMIKDGTSFDTQDTDFRRGNEYYFSYYVNLDLNFDGTSESTYPSDPSIILKSKIQYPNKQFPRVKMYPSTSTANSFTWKYTITDVDYALVENKFFYLLDGRDKGSIELVTTSNYRDVTFSSLSEGYLDVGIRIALMKKNENINTEQLIYQKFYSGYSAPSYKYSVYKEVNRVLFSFNDYQTNSFYNRVAGARIEFKAGGQTIVKDYLSINDGNIVVDYSDLESMMGLNITPTVYLYYDSGITGYETGYSTTALQMVDNNTADYDGKYYYMNTSSSFQTSNVPDRSLFNISLDTNTSKMSILNKKTNITKILDITQEPGGISHNYELMMPKAIKEQVGVNITDSTFYFDKIIPSISLLNDNGALDISPTLIGCKFNAKVYGAGGDRIKDDLIYLEIYHVDENGNNPEFISSSEYTVDELDGVIYVDGLTPINNYYAKFFAYVKSGDSYTKEQLYDFDFQTNTKNYYFKTLGDVGISNVSAKYEADSYEERKIKLTYKLREIVGYDRIEYEIYKRVTQEDDSVLEVKVDIPIENDYIFSQSMTKYINIPPGCGVDANESYKIIIRPYADTSIGGVEDVIELTPNNSTIFMFNKIAEPYVGISSTVQSTDSLLFKVNFYDTGKAVVDGQYRVSFYDDAGNDITPESYQNQTYATDGSRRFVLANLQERKNYEIKITYSVNILNGEDTIINREKKYVAKLIENNGISIGNFSVVTDVNDTSRIRLLFYDSYKLNELNKIRYSIYSSNGYSIDGEEEFQPYQITLPEGITYYYYTLQTILPETGQYYLQLQFIKDANVIAEESVEYNYIK